MISVQKKRSFVLDDSITPKLLEPVRSQFCVADCMLYVPMPHVVLDGSGIMPLPRQVEPGRMAQHVRMDREQTTGKLQNYGNYGTPIKWSFLVVPVGIHFIRQLMDVPYFPILSQVEPGKKYWTPIEILDAHKMIKWKPLR